MRDWITPQVQMFGRSGYQKALLCRGNSSLEQKAPGCVHPDVPSLCPDHQGQTCSLMVDTILAGERSDADLSSIDYELKVLAS